MITPPHDNNNNNQTKNTTTNVKTEQQSQTSTWTQNGKGLSLLKATCSLLIGYQERVTPKDEMYCKHPPFIFYQCYFSLSSEDRVHFTLNYFFSRLTRQQTAVVVPRHGHMSCPISDEHAMFNKTLTSLFRECWHVVFFFFFVLRFLICCYVLRFVRVFCTHGSL